MVTIRIRDLVGAVESEFSFLELIGIPLAESFEIFPESFKGGFELIFRAATGREVRFVYADLELRVCAGNIEVFGAANHEPFAGNMFNREHLIKALPKIRQAVEPTLRSFAQGDT